MKNLKGTPYDLFTKNWRIYIAFQMRSTHKWNFESSRYIFTRRSTQIIKESSHVYHTSKLFCNQKHTQICKWHTIIVYYKHDMSDRRNVAADIRDFQYSLYSSQELLYVKLSPDNPPCFWIKMPKGGGYLELIGLICIPSYFYCRNTAIWQNPILDAS